VYISLINDKLATRSIKFEAGGGELSRLLKARIRIKAWHAPMLGSTFCRTAMEKAAIFSMPDCACTITSLPLEVVSSSFA
jgi:hypothetical protein